MPAIVGGTSLRTGTSRGNTTRAGYRPVPAERDRPGAKFPRIERRQPRQQRERDRPSAEHFAEQEVRHKRHRPEPGAATVFLETFLDARRDAHAVHLHESRRCTTRIVVVIIGRIAT